MVNVDPLKAGFFTKKLMIGFQTGRKMSVEKMSVRTTPLRQGRVEVITYVRDTPDNSMQINSRKYDRSLSRSRSLSDCRCHCHCALFAR
jgi:hypothetical protein